MKRNNLCVFFLFLLFSLSIFNGCEKKEDYLIEIPETSNAMLKAGNKEIKDYDKRMQKLAKSIAKALNNNELRNTFKAKALEKWDGDTEFLYKNIKEIVLTGSNIKIKSLISEKADFNDIKLIKDELKEYRQDKTFIKSLERKNINDLKSTYFDIFSEDFPSLQIAVRGPLKDWDVENVHPKVVYVPFSFEENTEELPAYDENGNVQMLDIISEFTEPVIVVMKSERTNPEGELSDKYKKSGSISVNSAFGTLKSGTEIDPNEEPQYCITPPTPTITYEKSTTYGNYITWSFPTTDYPVQFTRCMIYRDGAGENDVLIGESGDGYPGSWNSLYDSWALESGVSYRYRMKVRYLSKSGKCYSAYSNYTAWSTPGLYNAAVSDFSVSSDGNNIMQLNWTKPGDPTTYNGFNIYRQIEGQSEGGQKIATITDKNDFNYTDAQSKPTGLNVRYWITPYTAYGDGTPKYDADKNTERMNGQDLYVTHLWCSDVRAIEAQIYGLPEFEIAITHVAEYDDQTEEWMQLPHVMQPLGAIMLEPVGLFNNGEFGAVYNWSKRWDNEFYKKVLVIGINEHDGTAGGAFGSIDMKKAFKAGVDAFGNLLPGKSVNDIVVTSIDAGFDFAYALSNGDDKCGQNVYAYWWPVNYTLTFDHGIKVRLSNEPSSLPPWHWPSEWNYN